MQLVLKYKEGHFLVAFKEAFITPMMKKPGTDAADASSFLIVLPFVINDDFEPVGVAKAPGTSPRPVTGGVYLSSADLLPSLQSGFCQGHSTETAVLWVLSNTLQAVRRPWWYSCPDPSGFISGLWHGRPCDRAIAAADNFGIDDSQCSSVVWVLAVRPASVRTPLVCAVNHHLPHLRCASGFGAGTSSVRPVHCGLDFAHQKSWSVAISLRRRYPGIRLVFVYHCGRTFIADHRVRRRHCVLDEIKSAPAKSG